MDIPSSPPPVRILHLEDNENDHLLVTEMLTADGLGCKFTLVKSRQEFTQAIRQQAFDLIISDYSLPSFDGLSALAEARVLHTYRGALYFFLGHDR